MRRTLAHLAPRSVKRSIRNVLGIDLVRQDLAAVRSNLRWSHSKPLEEMLHEHLPLKWLSHPGILREDPQLTYSIDEFFAFREILYITGWCLHERCSLHSIFVVFTSRIDRFPVRWLAGIKFSFSLPISIPVDQTDGNIIVGFEYSDGRRFVIEHPFRQSWLRDPYHRMFANFTQKVREIGEGSILEIGSRARSGNIYNEFVPPGMKYIGMDILDGPNVNLIGDAHYSVATHLSQHFQ